MDEPKLNYSYPDRLALQPTEPKLVIHFEDGSAVLYDTLLAETVLLQMSAATFQE